MHGLLMFQGMSLSQDQPSDVQLCILGFGVGLPERLVLGFVSVLFGTKC